MGYITFALHSCYFLKAGLDCLFLIQEVIFIAHVKTFHTKKCNE